MANPLQAQYSPLDLQSGTNPTGSEVAHWVQGGISVQLSLTQIFAAMGITKNFLVSFLSGDVALNNTATYFDGPSIAQGTVGTWLAFAIVTLADSAPPAQNFCKLWDGTIVISSTCISTLAGTGVGMGVMAGFSTNPAGNIKVSVKDVSTTTGSIKANQTANGNKDTCVGAVRIA